MGSVDVASDLARVAVTAEALSPQWLRAEQG